RLRRPVRAAGIDTLGAERKVEVDSDFERTRLENRQQYLPRRAGIGRRLEDDELAGTQARSDLTRGTDHDREIRLALRRQRGGQRDHDRVSRPKPVVVRRREQRVAGQRPQLLRGNVLDVALAAANRPYAIRRAVEQEDTP